MKNLNYEAFRGNFGLYETWGVYLFDHDFEGEPELRNKLMIIYIAGVFDLLDAELHSIPQTIKTARDNGYEKLAINGEQILNFCRVTAKFLNEFSESEQLFIQNLRNQWVHAYLNSLHRDVVGAKIIFEGNLLKKTYSHEEYHGIIRPHFEKGPLDDTLAEIRERALNTWPEYWRGLNFLCKSKNDIYRILRDDELIRIVEPII